jgi:hypothetical protein
MAPLPVGLPVNYYAGLAELYPVADVENIGIEHLSMFPKDGVASHQSFKIYSVERVGEAIRTIPGAKIPKVFFYPKGGHYRKISPILFGAIPENWRKTEWAWSRNAVVDCAVKNATEPYIPCESFPVIDDNEINGKHLPFLRNSRLK